MAGVDTVIPLTPYSLNQRPFCCDWCVLKCGRRRQEFSLHFSTILLMLSLHTFESRRSKGRSGFGSCIKNMGSFCLKLDGSKIVNASKLKTPYFQSLYKQI